MNDHPLIESANMILRVFDLAVLILIFGTLPLIVVLNYNLNYYWDYVSELFQAEETNEVYDFIVGK